MTRRKEPVGSFQVPDEIEREILSRLPVKSLIRFKKVKKSWRNLIEDSTFIAMHLNSYGRNTDGFFVYGCYSYGIELSKSLFDQPRKFIIGSINGLVCLSNKMGCFLKKDDRLRIHICNPSTREIMELPQLVKISYRRDWPSSEVQVQVYSLNMNSWKTIKMEIPSLLALSPLYRGNGCFNGAFHWQGLKMSPSKKVIKTIVWFQFEDEMFGEINLPNDPDFEGDAEFLITEYGNFFSCLIHERGQNIVNGYKVWAMKEYGVWDSWVKQLNIEIAITDLFGMILKPSKLKANLSHYYNGILFVAGKAWFHCPQKGAIRVDFYFFYNFRF
ncbi:hypothetical protein E1A91_A06G189000v1 [Gossypium mustelinum]|uniref:F-box domain-containing protein n=1 Tax=Gossypium mustelinum TaxID=34275 RepID=A0A5D2YXN6_GOSMU|nr:hypothetical protein E1A91_A06G189000v1 [Gossypium mustelinum]